MGYAAPEYIQTGHLTSKSDVWSFGVVLLEILSGRISLDPNRPRHEQNLLEWARPFLLGNRKINYMMDPKLAGKYSLVQAEKVLGLALESLNRYPRERPTMSAISTLFFRTLGAASVHGKLACFQQRLHLAACAVCWPVRRARTSGEAESDIVIGI